MTLVIKKKVSLDFLGEGYEEAYLIFKSIPLKDYQGIMEEMPDENDNQKSLELIVKYLKKYFVGGKFPDEDSKLQDVSVDDVDDLDGETAITCFQTLMGQRIDPKLEGQSMNPSTTEPEAPSN